MRFYSTDFFLVSAKPLLSLTKDFLIDIGGWPTLKQAQALVDSNRVKNARYEPPILSAQVEGGHVLTARLKIGTTLAEVENLCTCRQAKNEGTICPHVVAAGLEWLRRREVAAVVAEPNARSSPLSTQQKAPIIPQWKRFLLGTQPLEAAILQLAILFPLQFPQTLKEPEMRIILEGKTETQPHFLPWDAISKNDSHPYAISEQDETIFAFIEKWNEGKVPGIFAIKNSAYQAFLQLLVHHPQLWIGKKKRFEVRPLAQKPTLHLLMESAGNLSLKLDQLISTGGEKIDLSGGRWNWKEESILQEEPYLAGPYLPLAQGTVSIPRENMVAFLTRELPALSQRFNIDDTSGEIKFEKSLPQIQVTLEGGLSGMSARLEAIYGEQTFLLHPQLLQKSRGADEWRPDPKDALRFWSRDEKAEGRAMAEMMRAGFVGGHRSPENFFLSTEREIGNFLANRLPRWRNSWKVIFGPRMEALVPKLDYMEPEITLQSSGEDWLSLDLKLSPKTDSAEAKLSPAEIQRWLQTGQSHQRMEGNRLLLFPTTAWSELQNVLTDCDIHQETGSIKVEKKFAPYFVNAVETQGWQLSNRSQWPPPSTKKWINFKLPPELEKQMRPYQKHGVEWLIGLAENDFNGLLADEMGLGKTVQMLAFLRLLLLEKKGTALVVCPTSLVENWKLEATKFVPDLKVLLIHGSDRENLFAKISEFDLVITSYGLIRRDFEKYRAHLFTALVLDEAQHIKNRESQNAQSAKALAAKHRFVLTGTPLENSLFDLWSIFDFLMPGYLGSAKDFKDRYETPIAKQQDEATQQRLRQRLRPFFLRRTKEEVATDLPPKMEQVAWCDLTEEQTEVYRALLDQGRREVFDGSGKSGQGKNRIAVLTTLLRLRQACCHLNLLPAKEEARKWSHPSAKLDLCFELIDEAMDGNHRLLIFSQFVQLLHLVRAALQEREIPFCYLDGSTVARQEEVDRFQKNEAIPIFLISLKAGGAGLNLTGADTVIHLDPWWNPAVEDQATARAHRIGQRNSVNSYKLIARGTVEEKIMKLQERKKALIHANVSNDELFVESLSWDEMQELFE